MYLLFWSSQTQTQTQTQAQTHNQTRRFKQSIRFPCKLTATKMNGRNGGLVLYLLVAESDHRVKNIQEYNTYTLYTLYIPSCRPTAYKSRNKN